MVSSRTSSNASDLDSELNDYDYDAMEQSKAACLRLENGRGVSILSTDGRDDEGEQYRLNQEELTSLLMRPGVAERPVVLISVAGAFRGGKSFLLDFFLRYLYAEESARADGSWLGPASAPLLGFGWRGGCARDTTGLVLWSHPFLTTLPSGEQVSVLLMDTQGSFDEESSLRDSSMIFALATLLSSVQIYNLSQKITENDLQHLQVFTEFAEQGGGELPTLQLLVRDWTAPYQFPFGAAGGDEYLTQKLEERPGQPRELREVRRRLRQSFERVRCFLLPHPGLRAATDPAFDGQLSDLTEDFQQSLLELVPQLLAPGNLRVKMLEGRPMLARELAVHVNAYFDAFRNQVPSPRSIMDAMALARWQSAAAAARASLAAAARGTRALGRDALLARLRTARPTAALRPLAERAGDLPGLEALEKELDDQTAEYMKTNDDRLALAVAAATREWESYSRELLAATLCLHPSDPRLDAAAARAAAVARYEELVDDADYDDETRARLVTDLEERSVETLRVADDINKRNNAKAIEASLAVLQEALPSAPRLHTDDLAHTHADARRDAIAVFVAARSRPSAQQVPDPYLQDLEQRIGMILNSHRAENTRNKSQAASAALDVYSRVTRITAKQCRHQRDLREVHEAALRRAVSHVCARDGPNSSRHDDVVVELETWIGERFAETMDLNARNNSIAIEKAYKVFTDNMDRGFFQLSAEDFEAKLREFTDAAKEVLKTARVSLHYFGVDDHYYDVLQRRMQDSYEYYRLKNSARVNGSELVTATIATGLAAAAVLGSGPVRGAYAVGAAAAALYNRFHGPR